MVASNTLAYYDMATIAAVKSFVVRAAVLVLFYSTRKNFCEYSFLCYKTFYSSN